MIEVLTRQVVTARDCSNITGKSERYGRNVLQKIKIQLQKKKHQLITLEEYCDYMGFNPEIVKPFLKMF